MFDAYCSGIAIFLFLRGGATPRRGVAPVAPLARARPYARRRPAPPPVLVVVGVLAAMTPATVPIDAAR